MKLKRGALDAIIMLAAAAFTGAEAAVGAGIKLPGSDTLPWWVRAIGYILVMGGGFAFRLWATKRAGVNRGQ